MQNMLNAEQVVVWRGGTAGDWDWSLAIRAAVGELVDELHESQVEAHDEALLLNAVDLREHSHQCHELVLHARDLQLQLTARIGAVRWRLPFTCGGRLLSTSRVSVIVTAPTRANAGGVTGSERNGWRRKSRRGSPRANTAGADRQKPKRRRPPRALGSGSAQVRRRARAV